VELKLKQIKKFENLKFNLKNLPRQINHGDFLTPNCFFNFEGDFKYLIDFEHIVYTYRIYDIVKTSLFLSREEEYEISNSGKYNFEKIIYFIKEYMIYNPLISAELELIPYLVLFMSIKSDLVLYGNYIAKNSNVRDFLPKGNMSFYYTWWEKNYLNLKQSMEKEFI
jgi:Ser/Thr protein kinase RdoA (MazF antagonist)